MIGGLLTTVARITMNFGIIGGRTGAGVVGPAGAVVAGVVCSGAALVLATVLAAGIVLTATEQPPHSNNNQ